MVDWIWFGFMLLAIGDRHRAGPGQRARTDDGGGDRDRRRGRAFGGRGEHRAVAGAGRGRRGADVVPAGGGADGDRPERSAHARRRRRELAGAQHRLPVQTCRHNLLECESEGCGHATQDRLAIRQLLNQGRTREQVIEYFIKKYGGQVALAAPLDRGFNRLAWLFPYSIAALAAGGLGYGGLSPRQATRRPGRRRTFHLRPGSCRQAR